MQSTDLLKLFFSFFISQILFVFIVSVDLVFLSKTGISGLAGAGFAAIVYGSIYIFFHGFAVIYSNFLADAMKKNQHIENFNSISLSISGLSIACYYLLSPVVCILAKFILESDEDFDSFLHYSKNILWQGKPGFCSCIIGI